MAQEMRTLWPREAVTERGLLMNHGWVPSWGSGSRQNIELEREAFQQRASTQLFMGVKVGRQHVTQITACPEITFIGHTGTEYSAYGPNCVGYILRG